MIFNNSNYLWWLEQDKMQVGEEALEEYQPVAITSCGE